MRLSSSAGRSLWPSPSSSPSDSDVPGLQSEGCNFLHKHAFVKREEPETSMHPLDRLDPHFICRCVPSACIGQAAISQHQSLGIFDVIKRELTLATRSRLFIGTRFPHCHTSRSTTPRSVQTRRALFLQFFDHGLEIQHIVIPTPALEVKFSSTMRPDCEFRLS